MDLLEPGDSVMADRGFTIADLLAVRKVTLNIPPIKTNDHFSENGTYHNTTDCFATDSCGKGNCRIKSYKKLPNNIARVVDQIFMYAQRFQIFIVHYVINLFLEPV